MTILTKKHVVRVAGVFAAAWVLTAAAGVADAQEPPRTAAEKIKERVGGAVESLKKGAASAEQAIRDQFERARAGVSKMGTEARVYARLHWDKTLNSAKIDLAAPREGMIVLTGVVPDAAARAKAVTLTSETVGVLEVVDRLTVQTTAAVGGGAVPAPPSR